MSLWLNLGLGTNPNYKSPSGVLNNAYFALSTRKVVSSYTGFAMKVRSDSVEANVSFDTNGVVSLSSPITITSGTSSSTTLGELVTDHGGDASVVTWYNQGSFNTNASQSITSRQPKIVVSGSLQQNSNGDTSILFDNHLRWLLTGSSVMRPETSAVYGYCEHNDGSYGGGLTHIMAQYTGSGAGRGGLGSGGFGMVAFVNGTDTLVVRDSQHQGGNFSAATTTDPTIASYFKTPSTAGTAKWLQADTVRGKPTSGFGTGVTDTFSGVTPLNIVTGIGGGDDSLAAKWDGFITEVISFDGTFSEDDWNTGFSEINDFYGVYS